MPQNPQKYDNANLSPPIMPLDTLKYSLNACGTQPTCSFLPGKYLFFQEHLHRRPVLQFFNHINPVLYSVRNINSSGYYLQDFDQHRNKIRFFFQFSTEDVLKIIYLIYKE